MKRISFPTPNSLRRFACWAMLFALPFAAKSQVDFAIATSQNGDQVTAHVVVANFTDIISMQYTMQWNPAELAYAGVENFNLPDLATSSFGVTQTSSGKLTFSWIDFTTNGITVPNCSAIFAIRFQD